MEYSSFQKWNIQTNEKVLILRSELDMTTLNNKRQGSTYDDALQRIREKAFYAHLLNAKTDEDEYLEVIPLDDVLTQTLFPFVKRIDDLWLSSFQCLVQKRKEAPKVLRVIELSIVEKALSPLALQSTNTKRQITKIVRQ